MLIALRKSRGEMILETEAIQSTLWVPVILKAGAPRRHVTYNKAENFSPQDASFRLHLFKMHINIIGFFFPLHCIILLHSTPPIVIMKAVGRLAIFKLSINRERITGGTGPQQMGWIDDPPIWSSPCRTPLACHDQKGDSWEIIMIMTTKLFMKSPYLRLVFFA